MTHQDNNIVAIGPYATIERVPFFGYYLLKLLADKRPNSVRKHDLYDKIPTFVLDCIINIFQKKDIIKLTEHEELDDKRTQDEKLQIELTGNGITVYEALKINIAKPEEELRFQFGKFFDAKQSHLKEKRNSIFDGILGEYKAQVRKELGLHYSDTNDSFIVNVKKELQSNEDYKSLVTSLRAYAFVSEAYNSFLSKENQLTGLKEINLFLDTDVLISILTKCDHWYGSTHSMLHTMEKLKNNGVVKVNILISRKTLDEFWAVLRTVGRIVNAILCDKEILKTISNDPEKISSKYSFSPIVEFFMGYWPTYELYTNDILRRFQNMINQYNIKLTSTEEEASLLKTAEGQIRGDAEKYIKENDIKSPGKKEVIYHDFYLLNLIHKKMDSNRTKSRYWLWTYDRNISSNIEKPYIGKTGGTISSLLLLPLLEMLDFTNSNIDPKEMLEFAKDYYHILFSKEENEAKYLNQLKSRLIDYLRYVKSEAPEDNTPNLIDRLQLYQKNLPEEFDLLKDIFERTEAVLFT